MKKGFTLVELLGVIVILSVLLIIVFATVSTIVNDGKNSVYKSQINSILSGAYDWSLKYPSRLPQKKGDKVYVSYLELIRDGYVDELINPKTKEKFPIDLVISIEYTGGNYKYDNTNSKLNGSYLFSVLLNNKSTNSLVKPTIIIDGLTADSDGNYNTEIEIGSVYANSAVSATENGNDVTNISEIMFNKKYEEKHKQEILITTNKLGMYYKYIVAIDDNGNSNSSILTIIVKDTENPVFWIDGYDQPISSNEEVPNDKKIINISINDSSVNLKQDLRCEDNSGKCDIEVSHNINYGVEGSYEVKYTAKDPSGHSIFINRTVRIENN